jgi:hypothetical protein
MRVEANGTHMVHQVLSSYDGALLDEFTLTKPLGWRFQPRPASLGSAESSSRGSGGSTHSSSSLMSGPWGRLFGRMWTNGAPAAVA